MDDKRSLPRSGLSDEEYAKWETVCALKFERFSELPEINRRAIVAGYDPRGGEAHRESARVFIILILIYEGGALLALTEEGWRGRRPKPQQQKRAPLVPPPGRCRT